MGELTKVEEAINSLKFLMFTEVLLENGLNFGKYPLEEISKMYNKHSNEIVLD
jgi:hypothetical protein